jgi:predicted RNase H-like nuclease (RuvC/YqgF family)
MAAFGFRTRSRERDRNTDSRRLQRLLTLMRDLREEMRQERDGLRNRYESTAASAAFAQEAYENGGGERMSARVDELTAAIMRYHARIEELEEQIAFMLELERRASEFAGAVAAHDHVEDA